MRERTLRSFSSGTVSILVASDLVSRGLDLPNLAHVINYDVPSSLTSYVHRVGRTARAGRKGHAWTFFTDTDGGWFWNDIARATAINRERKVGRVNIQKEIFGEIQRKRYEDALEKLGNETRSSMRMRE
jgi:ATP-dependent RNA helicase DDX51/DBP6